MALDISYSLPVISAGLPRLVVIWGDSKVNGTGAGTDQSGNAVNGLSRTSRSVLQQSLGSAYHVINNGVGGEAPEPIADRFIANAAAYGPDAIHIIAFGRPDYARAFTDYTAQAQRCRDAHPDATILFVVPEPGSSDNERINGGANIAIANDARKELMETFPDNHIDTMKYYWDASATGDFNAAPTFQAGTTPPNSTITNGQGATPMEYLVGPFPDGPDRIHNNSAGHALQGQSWYDAVVAVP